GFEGRRRDLGKPGELQVRLPINPIPINPFALSAGPSGPESQGCLSPALMLRVSLGAWGLRQEAVHPSTGSGRTGEARLGANGVRGKPGARVRGSKTGSGKPGGLRVRLPANSIPINPFAL